MMVSMFAAGCYGLAPDVVDDVGGVEVAVVGEVEDVATAAVPLVVWIFAQPVAFCEPSVFRVADKYGVLSSASEVSLPIMGRGW